MGLQDPLSERNPEKWLVRFLTHFVVGFLAWHALIWTVSPVHAAWAVPVVYLVAWEIAAQRVGAGWWDAVADTLAVALGTSFGLNLLLGANLWAFVGLLLAFIAATGWGVGKRL